MDLVNKEKIAQALYNKDVTLPCPRCTSSNFEVVGQTLLTLNEDPHIVTLGGPALPSAIIACSNCGYITLHALSSLNLMPHNNQDDANEQKRI
jgi:predicted nucleic-acid-binding Zn-ribbon protein